MLEPVNHTGLRFAEQNTSSKFAVKQIMKSVSSIKIKGVLKECEDLMYLQYLISNEAKTVKANRNLKRNWHKVSSPLAKDQI